MKSQALALLLALILAPTSSAVALAQTNSGQPQTNTNVQDWQGLRGLEHGKKLLVEFKTGSTIEGKFDGVTGSTLSLSSGGSTYTVEQRDIQRVYRLKGRWSRRTTARIGAGIGMVVGLLIGTKMVVDSPRTDHPGAFAGLSLGALTGAGMGALVGGKRKGELLYEAK